MMREEEPAMSGEEQMRDGAKRLAREASARFLASRNADLEPRRRLERRVQVVVLAVVVVLLAAMCALAIGCCSSVPEIVRDKAPRARRAAELYVERTAPLLDAQAEAEIVVDPGDPMGAARQLAAREHAAETRELGEALVRYLREMEDATR